MPGKVHAGSRKTLWTAALTIFVAVAMTPVASAAPQSEEYGEEIRVEEVLLDVVVTDPSGQIVLGLDEDDFIVRDEGERVELNEATFYSNRRYLGSADRARELGIDVDAVPSNRYFILFFHHQHDLLPRLSANLLDAGRRAKQWVGSLEPNDYVAVVSYYPKYNLQDFTNNAEAIRAAIDDAVRRRDFQPRETATASDLPSMTAALPPGDVDRIYEALAMTAEGAGAIRGRKNLVLFSIGFGEPVGYGFFRPDTRYYPEMIRTINDNNVAVYPVDLLATDLSPFFLVNAMDNVLNQMAAESGGQLYTTFNNYLAPLEKIASDNNGYYLLSYTLPDGAEDGEYRQVSVEMANARFDARTREGYVAGSGYPYVTQAGERGR